MLKLKHNIISQNLIHINPKLTVKNQTLTYALSFRKKINLRIPSSGNTITKTQTAYIWSVDLIKLLLKVNTKFWTSGTISNLIFTYDYLYAQKLTNIRNSRKSWSVWLYTTHLWWSTNAQYLITLYKPWSLRLRRMFKLTTVKTTISIIYWTKATHFTPKRRIKRWLKKKYTTQSWR